jgi:hypothetical protein
MPYPSLDEQIREFGVVQFCGWYFIPCHRVQSRTDYNHDYEVIHHFIKEQEYYRHPERYKGQQKLILMPHSLHNDIHSSMSDERFFKKWKIEKSKLLYRMREVQ